MPRGSPPGSKTSHDFAAVSLLLEGRQAFQGGSKTFLPSVLEVPFAFSELLCPRRAGLHAGHLAPRRIIPSSGSGVLLACCTKTSLVEEGSPDDSQWCMLCIAASRREERERAEMREREQRDMYCRGVEEQCREGSEPAQRAISISMSMSISIIHPLSIRYCIQSAMLFQTIID